MVRLMGRVAGLGPAETKQRVLDAAAAVFAQAGYEGARMAQIAKAADLSVGAIYNHYPSKAELLAAVVQRHGAHELGRLLAGGEPMGVPELIAVLGASLDQGPPAAPLLAEVILAARRDPEVAAILVREVGGRESLFADFVRFGQAAGEVVADVDPAVVARFCLMLSLGSLMVRALDLPSTDPDAWVSAIKRIVDAFRNHDKENQ
ncbi:MAG TPA: TetR/AcrR family transcriptional regulator [Acidimicrobiales bacterium]|nr:TetR/AcrR family transcriptional regulator [Acidimicrobiales bacterium]